ncbi:hypothetical protein AMAG_01231 [Allomyces macrogynus ATCC 38327]|uniref:BHLH domain-containing protein n=1 Tax=Allomyces macrogynus (strain ATCC 38327) TaxID=578462 RepID=A0A0L0RZ24_ALLM3|nr:hypothetical protein AMAG_01231 [Allomyces macrogynus ATCC 38327]|eukprot:KNE55329.1 hypothetical protein AMAG_01231 [Allomyces macrogynus ATCC 38327]
MSQADPTTAAVDSAAAPAPTLPLDQPAVTEPMDVDAAAPAAAAAANPATLTASPTATTEPAVVLPQEVSAAPIVENGNADHAVPAPEAVPVTTADAAALQAVPPQPTQLQVALQAAMVTIPPGIGAEQFHQLQQQHLEQYQQHFMAQQAAMVAAAAAAEQQQQQATQQQQQQSEMLAYQEAQAQAAAQVQAQAQQDAQQPSRPTSAASGAKPPLGTDEWLKQRRESHKEVERRRREVINTGIAELAKIVPNCSDRNKGGILHRAVQYIQQLKEAEQRNAERWTLDKMLADQAINDLTGYVEFLKAENEALRGQITALGGEAPPRTQPPAPAVPPYHAHAMAAAMHPGYHYFAPPPPGTWPQIPGYPPHLMQQQMLAAAAAGGAQQPGQEVPVMHADPAAQAAAVAAAQAAAVAAGMMSPPATTQPGDDAVAVQHHPPQFVVDGMMQQPGAELGIHDAAAAEQQQQQQQQELEQQQQQQQQFQQLQPQEQPAEAAATNSPTKRKADDELLENGMDAEAKRARLEDSQAAMAQAAAASLAVATEQAAQPHQA